MSCNDPSTKFNDESVTRPVDAVVVVILSADFVVIFKSSSYLAFVPDDNWLIT